ncbi:uncharacterized protein BDZ83DRAFT_187388 [Colletotrichum acutatum]|uniref:Uncharacterized protein n=1 Tax=Glomerella acutata TaxID=27357 RepID=A0AAD8UNL9_GLOAC|nr:uncharacterized protein BDZ83DRAFT_187388 [Colletotrichum acutatum]KAK1727727.1 hypothetical protein BDZ83DRAFT_187388 [Colletotrichum acutatum]
MKPKKVYLGKAHQKREEEKENSCRETHTHHTCFLLPHPSRYPFPARKPRGGPPSSFYFLVRVPIPFPPLPSKTWLDPFFLLSLSLSPPSLSLFPVFPPPFPFPTGNCCSRCSPCLPHTPRPSKVRSSFFPFRVQCAFDLATSPCWPICPVARLSACFLGPCLVTHFVFRRRVVSSRCLSSIALRSTRGVFALLYPILRIPNDSECFPWSVRYLTRAHIAVTLSQSSLSQSLSTGPRDAERHHLVRLPSAQPSPFSTTPSCLLDNRE